MKCRFGPVLDKPKALAGMRRCLVHGGYSIAHLNPDTCPRVRVGKEVST